MPVSRNDACPCGSGKKYKKCCLGAPDPKAVRKSKILVYGSLALAAATIALVFLVGQGVGSAVGLGSFFVLIGYALAGSSSSEPPAAAPSSKAGKAAKAARR
jgi:hypothetical protein